MSFSLYRNGIVIHCLATIIFKHPPHIVLASTYPKAFEHNQKASTELEKHAYPVQGIVKLSSDLGKFVKT
jgi:hypothetical protein